MLKVGKGFAFDLSEVELLGLGGPAVRGSAALVELDSHRVVERGCPLVYINVYLD